MRKTNQPSSFLLIAVVSAGVLLVLGIALLVSSMIPFLYRPEDYLEGQDVSLLYSVEGAFPPMSMEGALFEYAQSLAGRRRTLARVQRGGEGQWVVFVDAPDREKLLERIPSARSGFHTQIVGRYLMLSTIPLNLSDMPMNPLARDAQFRPLWKGNEKATSALFVRFPVLIDLPPVLFSSFLLDLSSRVPSGTAASVMEHADSSMLRFSLPGRRTLLEPLRRLQAADVEDLKREGGKELSVLGYAFRENLPELLNAFEVALGSSRGLIEGRLRALIDRAFGQEFSVVHDLGAFLSGIGAISLYEDESGRASFAVVGRGSGRHAGVLLQQLSERTAAHSRGVTLVETILPDGRVDRRLRQADAARIQTFDVSGKPLTLRQAQGHPERSRGMTLILDQRGEELLARIDAGGVRGVGSHSQVLRRSLRLLPDFPRKASREVSPPKNVGLIGIMSGGIPLFEDMVGNPIFPFLQSLTDLRGRLGDFLFTVADEGELVTVAFTALRDGE